MDKDTKTIFPDETNLVINGASYCVTPFRLGKTLRMLEYVSELLEVTDVNSILRAAQKGQAELIGELTERLPLFMRTARPTLLKALALTLIPDTRLSEIDEKDESFDAELAAKVRAVKDAEPEKAIEILSLGIKSMGLDKIRKNFPTLLQSLRSL